MRFRTHEPLRYGCYELKDAGTGYKLVGHYELKSASTDYKLVGCYELKAPVQITNSFFASQKCCRAPSSALRVMSTCWRQTVLAATVRKGLGLGLGFRLAPSSTLCVIRS